jgi:hypothetical protein
MAEPFRPIRDDCRDGEPPAPGRPMDTVTRLFSDPPRRDGLPLRLRLPPRWGEEGGLPRPPKALSLPSSAPLSAASLGAG